MKLVFLGTGGSIPTTERNLPALAIARGRELLLFDCAESTQRQMAKAGLSPMRVSAIFITHFHGDHFLGLAGLVQTMSLLNRSERLEVYGPEGARDLIENFLHVPIYTLTFDVEIKEIKANSELKREGYTIKTCALNHSVPGLAYAMIEDRRPGKFYPEKAISLGIKPGPNFSKLQRGESVKTLNGSIVTPDLVMGKPRPGRKIVYATDTRPSEGIVELARDADVLIHDCTFSDDLADRARENGHSTASEAAEVAKKANVGQLFLTHISPRYSSDEELTSQAKKIFPNVVVARDLMEIEIKLKE